MSFTKQGYKDKFTTEDLPTINFSTFSKTRCPAAARESTFTFSITLTSKLPLIITPVAGISTFTLHKHDFNLLRDVKYYRGVIFPVE